MTTLNPAAFDFLADFLKRRSGLVLARDKAYLVESRLLPIARRLGKPDVGELIAMLRSAAPPSDLVRDIVEAMTTN
jgi:chemotaxis protein methyltransferase CheR